MTEQALRPEEARAVTPLTEAELALYREGLRSAPSLDDMPDPHIPTPGRSLLQITTAEWADRCRRLLATLDAARPDEALRTAAKELADAFERYDKSYGATVRRPGNWSDVKGRKRVRELAQALTAKLQERGT